MDERRAALDGRVAAAADAWLTDPQDTGVYGRLVDAINVRRAYLNPPLDQEPPDADPPDPPPQVTQADELLDELGDGAAAPRAVGADLRGDPTGVIARLRGSSPSTAS